MRHLLLALLLLSTPALAQEDMLIGILRSDAPVKEKMDACRELARVGTRTAVPALAALLTDEKLSVMARYALEPIPDSAVDTALRQTLAKAKGRPLIGIIASLGVRRDLESVKALTAYLNNADPMVAQAAAHSLGSFGAPAAPALKRALATATVDRLPAICEGLFRCADSLPPQERAAIYDRVLKVKNLPARLYDAALWDSIRARENGGIPLMLKTIQSGTAIQAAGALQVSAELPGSSVTRALSSDLRRPTVPRRVMIARALGNRRDPTAAPALARSAAAGEPAERIAAIEALVQIGSPSSLPALIALLRDPEESVAGAARSGLAGYPGGQADAAIVGLVNRSDAKTRAAAIDIAVVRRITSALSGFLKAAGDENATVASAGFRAVGELATMADLPEAVDVLVAGKSVPEAEAAVAAICARQPDVAACADKLLPGLAKAQGESKLALLRLLGAIAGPKALAAVRTAALDSSASVRETAVRAMCDWPTCDALPDLEKIASGAAEPKEKILAQRGQLRLIPSQPVPDAQKVAQIKVLMPMLERKEEQVLALTALAEIPCAESMALVAERLTGSMSEEAAVAAVAIAEKIVAAHPAEVADALQQIQSSNGELNARVQKVLAKVPAGAADAGFTSIFNGKDLTGWDGKPGWWKVEDGTLTAESTAQKQCTACNYLIWRGGQPGDFEIRAEFKLSLSANSGIQIRSEERPDWDTFGYQADMTGDGELVGYVYHHARGLIAARGERATFDAAGKKTVQAIGNPVELLKHFKKGDWNTYRVVCRGPEMALYINGALMCHITDPGATGKAGSGIIALQMHPGPPMKVQFKNIRLKELR